MARIPGLTSQAMGSWVSWRAGVGSERQTDLFERVNNDQVNHEQTYGPHGFQVDEAEVVSHRGEDIHT